MTPSRNTIGGSHPHVEPSRSAHRSASLSVVSPGQSLGDGVGNPALLKNETGKAERATSIDNRRDPVIYGNGFSAQTPIEGAARQGYLDRIAGRGFSAEYDAAIGQWQRNYEAGRQWATAILAIGQTPAEWQPGAKVPADLLDQLDDVRCITGSGTRPEDTKAWMRPGDDPSRLLAVVPTVRRGRIIERIAI